MHSGDKDKEIKNLQKKVKKLEAALRIVTDHSIKTESRIRKQFEVISETIPVPILISNATGDIYFANLNAQKTYGYSPEKFIQINDLDLYSHPEERKKFIKILLNKGEVDGFRAELKKCDGSVFSAILFSKQICFDGQESHVTVVHDLTELIALEKQLQQAHKMESIGTLTGGIAHDFNNILSIIIGNTELALTNMPDWNPIYKNISVIKTASLRAKDVVKQLLSFTRVTEQEQKPLDIIKIVKESLRLIRSSIPSSIEIRENIPEKVDAILADATQIHQVIINMCTNAAHAMVEGVLEVSVSKLDLNKNSQGIFKDLIPGTYLELVIKDTGMGIDPQIIERIFDPYFTTKEVGKGSGMGLAVVHGIVKNHNGKIFVSSKSGEGTTFRIIFPTIKEQPEPDIEEISMGINTIENNRILFVDDEETLVQLAEISLEKIGYRVRGFTNPVEALAEFETHLDHYDLVITDMTMPQMNGVMFSEKLKNLRSNIPIIISTGYSSLIDEEKSRAIGISAYAMKPIMISEMADLIKQVLKSQ